MALQHIYDHNSAPQHAYLPIKPDSSQFYPSLVGGMYGDPTKDVSIEAWRGLHQGHHGYYLPCEPVLSAYPYAPSFSAMGFDAARRKNATKEATNSLKAWLYEHRKNPYPTKGEKIMLAIITKMTMTQISTWFANARRRLKKENKMTWSPKSRSDDEDSEAEGDTDLSVCDRPSEDASSMSDRLQGAASPEVDTCHKSPSHVNSTDRPCSPNSTSPSQNMSQSFEQILPANDVASSGSRSCSPEPDSPSNHTTEKCTNRSDMSPKPLKPKIWSISEVLSDSHPSAVPSTENNTSSVSNYAKTARSNFQPVQQSFYTSHASHVLRGQGFAILSGNGGATHTWNPLSLPSGLYTNQHPLTLKYPHPAIHERMSCYPGYQNRAMTSSSLSCTAERLRTT